MSHDPSEDLDTAIEVMQSHRNSDALAVASRSSINCAAYCNRKRKILLEFIEALKKAAPRYDHFLKKTKEVPTFFKVKEIEVVYVMLSGEEGKRKKLLALNDMLIDWIGNKKKLDGGWPCPGTLNSTVRAFLSATKTYFDWKYCLSDFKFDGGYNGYFKTLCKMRQKEDVSLNFFQFLPSFFLHLHTHHLLLHLYSLFQPLLIISPITG